MITLDFNELVVRHRELSKELKRLATNIQMCCQFT